MHVLGCWTLQISANIYISSINLGLLLHFKKIPKDLHGRFHASWINSFWGSHPDFIPKSQQFFHSYPTSHSSPVPSSWLLRYQCTSLSSPSTRTFSSSFLFYRSSCTQYINLCDSRLVFLKILISSKLIQIGTTWTVNPPFCTTTCICCRLLIARKDGWILNCCLQPT